MWGWRPGGVLKGDIFNDIALLHKQYSGAFCHAGAWRCAACNILAKATLPARGVV
jgi:hypothetical protein